MEGKKQLKSDERDEGDECSRYCVPHRDSRRNTTTKIKMVKLNLTAHISFRDNIFAMAFMLS